MLLTVLFFAAAFPALAQENALQNDSSIESAPLVQNDENAFYNPEEELGEIKDIERPACTARALTERVRIEAEHYLKTQPAASSIAKRQKALIIANINDFEEISAENFEPEQNLNTANALITLKINRRINASDITLCRQKEGGKIYLIIYPYQDNFKVHIINLASYDPENEGISFIYP